MHKHDICEEIGRGYGKVIYATIKNLILALKIKNQGDKFTKVTLQLRTPFNLISKEYKVKTYYFM